MLRDAGAVGGINADFFGVVGQYSVHFSSMARDGQLLSANVGINANHGEFATFFMDIFNNASFQYMRTDIRFYNNGVRNINIGRYNNIGHAMDMPTVVDRLAMHDTTAINARFPGLTSIVVDNSRIVRVSLPGETIVVPANGYVILLPQTMAYRRRYFNVGDLAALIITNNLGIDFSLIQSAIGGGGLILSQGEIVNDRGTVAAGRQPRSAVGVSACGRYLILMVVDGRSHSVGVTHAETAYLLRMYGAYNAMHFDSGGSSTLVVSDRGENHTAVNTVSDGNERRVINALGVFDSAPIGDITQIVLNMYAAAVVGTPASAVVYGEDRHQNRIPINMANVTLSVGDTAGGTWQSGAYTPRRAGTHILEARYGNHSTTLTINAYVLAELRSHTSSISLFEGGSIALNFYGIAVCGSHLDIPNVTELRVTPSNLGYFDNNVFVATNGGAGYITAGIGNIRTYIPVSVGGFPVGINMLNSYVGSLAVPADNLVNVITHTIGGRSAISMDYVFDVSTATQAAYVTFYPALSIPGTPAGLRLQVYGDGSGHWLRGRVRDATGRIHLIDFTREADFVGWHTVTAVMPNAEGPFTIDQIYMVTLYSHQSAFHRTRFYGLEAISAPPHVAVPQGAQFFDAMRGHFVNGRDFSFGISSTNAYTTFAWADFAVAIMTARGGGISAADSSQWTRFMPDLRAINSQYIVVLMDENPLNFTRQMEFELFHLAMQELQNEGRQVFVVSATDIGTETELTIMNGVRYINLEQPQQGIAIISFSVYNGQVRWR